MKRALAILVAILGLGLVVQSHQALPRGLVLVRDSDDRPRAFFEPLEVEYRADRCCPHKMAVGYPGVRDSSGVIVSALGFYAWRLGGATHLRVVLMVPGPGAPNRFLWETEADRALLRPRDFATLTLTLDKPRAIEEMKKLGLAPLRVTLVSKPPRRTTLPIEPLFAHR
jgi:hypothetical protein